MNREMMELYTEHLISSFGRATGLSSMVYNSMNHDQVTRFLAKAGLTSKLNRLDYIGASKIT